MTPYLDLAATAKYKAWEARRNDANAKADVAYQTAVDLGMEPGDALVMSVDVYRREVAKGPMYQPNVR